MAADGIVFSLKEEGNPDICYNVGAIKPVTKG